MSFSVRQGSYEGRATLEILVDGRPWGADKFGAEHFVFGITKARMVRAALLILEKFVDSRGGKPWPGQVKRFTDLTGRDVIPVEVAKHDDFQGFGGNQVNQPYLQLTSGRRSLGLGLKKCEGLLVLWRHVDDFLSSNGHNLLFGQKSLASPTNTVDDDKI